MRKKIINSLVQKQKIEKLEHFLRRRVKKKKIKKSRLRAFARTRAKNMEMTQGSFFFISSGQSGIGLDVEADIQILKGI